MRALDFVLFYLHNLLTYNCINMTNLDDQGDEILRSLKEKYPSLTIAFVNNAISVRLPGFWTAVAYKENGAWVINDPVSYTHLTLPTNREV